MVDFLQRLFCSNGTFDCSEKLYYNTWQRDFFYLIDFLLSDSVVSLTPFISRLNLLIPVKISMVLLVRIIIPLN